MKLDREPAAKTEERGISSVSVLFGRLMWFIIGPALLLGLTYGMVTRRNGWFTPLDAAYFVVVGLMVLGRWKEQHSGVATTAEGKPATWDHYHRYIRLLLPVAAIVWVLVKITANYILDGGA
jgi:hypothetical protein